MLALLDKAARQLAQCATVDQAKSIRDKAQALEVYAKQAKQSAVMERQCAVIRLRAERRIGELLASEIKRGRKRSHDATIKLSSLGISKSQSSRWQLAATVPEADFEKYLASKCDLTTGGVLRLVRREPVVGPRSGGDILTGPASQLWDRLKNESVDLFFTDPPYAEIDLYSELSELAAAKLKPGGLCLAYSGVGYLPAVLAAMAKHLEYHWLFAIEFSGPHSPLYPLKIFNSWQPVVAFRKGKCSTTWLTDHLHGAGREKTNHAFQKTGTDCEYLVEKLTSPGELVVDPFCGSGTVLAACKKLGRRWLGCEIDSQTARVARGRVAA